MNIVKNFTYLSPRLWGPVLINAMNFLFICIFLTIRETAHVFSSSVSFVEIFSSENMLLIGLGQLYEITTAHLATL